VIFIICDKPTVLSTCCVQSIVNNTVWCYLKSNLTKKHAEKVAFCFPRCAATCFLQGFLILDDFHLQSPVLARGIPPPPLPPAPAWLTCLLPGPWLLGSLAGLAGLPGLAWVGLGLVGLVCFCWPALACSGLAGLPASWFLSPGSLAGLAGLADLTWFAWAGLGLVGLACSCLPWPGWPAAS